MIRRWWRTDLGNVERFIFRVVGTLFAVFAALALLPEVVAVAFFAALGFGLVRAVRWAVRTDRAEHLTVKLEQQLGL